MNKSNRRTREGEPHSIVAAMKRNGPRLDLRELAQNVPHERIKRRQDPLEGFIAEYGGGTKIRHLGSSASPQSSCRLNCRSSLCKRT